MKPEETHSRNPGANLKSISHRCYLQEEAFEWELTEETIHLPLGCLPGGFRCELLVTALSTRHQQQVMSLARGR